MAKKGQTVEEMIANRYWITDAGVKALEDYEKEQTDGGDKKVRRVRRSRRSDRSDSTHHQSE